jgi:hypothetical protein
MDSQPPFQAVDGEYRPGNIRVKDNFGSSFLCFVTQILGPTKLHIFFQCLWIGASRSYSSEVS